MLFFPFQFHALQLLRPFVASASIWSFYPYCNPLRPGFQKIQGEGPEHLATIPHCLIVSHEPVSLARIPVFAQTPDCLVFLYQFASSFQSLQPKLASVPWSLSSRARSPPYFSRRGLNIEG
ncbi:hypothetical protein V8F20_007641 [Naviculisporaceae sp. PSN 640]